MFSSLQLVSFLLSFFRSSRKRIVSFFSLSLVLTGVSVVVPMLTRRLINIGISEGSASAIVWSTVGLGVIGISHQLISLLSQSLEIGISQDVVKRLRERLAEDISWLSSDVHSDKDSGYMISRVQSDAQSIGSLIRSLATLGNQILMLGASIVLTWILLKSAVLVLLPTVIMVFLVGMYAYRVIHKRSMVTMESGAVAFGSVGELVEGRETLAAQGGSKRITAEVIKKQADNISKVKHLILTQTRLRTVTGIIRTVGLTVFLAWSGFRVAWGVITFGDWYAINLYAGMVLGAVISIASTFQGLGQTKAAADRVQEIMLLAEKEKERFGDNNAGYAGGIISVRNLTFSYEDNPPVISQLNLSITSGTLALISGPSGAGKTTLCKLLSGQLEPDEGEVLVGGKPPLSVGHASECGTVAVLPQEVFIFNASIRDNIRLGYDGASHKDIEEAAVRAGIHDEIMKMENGFDTVTGPRGNKLSLGQKRRIALARSLLADPELIILDEPFASLDRENVLKLSKSLRECTERCTVIVVSHGWEEELKADVRFSIR
ncbi:MAG: ATP-binding cassette domain-containing protein [Candidatus Aegiribacteria sp.]|nr:ATP-binding cassette domain-containing protein [Candidatus Aegiribacteria sp.]